MIEIELMTDGNEDFVERFANFTGQIRSDEFKTSALPAPVLAGLVQLPLPKPKQFWMANLGGEGVAQIGANVSLGDDELGFIGFFEFDTSRPEAKSAAIDLLELAAEWLSDQGCVKAYGPINYNTWFPYRYRTDSDKSYRFGWEPNCPKEYAEVFSTCGFESFENYHSQGFNDLKTFVAETKASYDRAIDSDYSFRPLASETLFERDIPSLYRITMAGLSRNFLFEPITEKAFSQLYIPMADQLDMSLSHIVTTKDGEDVAFLFCFEDQGFLVFKNIVVVPDERGRDLSNAVAHICGKKALERGVSKLLMAMVKEGAQSESYGKKANEVWRHTYSLFARNCEVNE